MYHILLAVSRLFGGIVADIKRKLPWYVSDFKDAFHVQCLASVVYIYIAALTPIVTFGGLLSDATDEYMVSISLWIDALKIHT